MKNLGEEEWKKCNFSLKRVCKISFYSFINPKGKLVISHFGSNFVSNDSILNIETNVENGAQFQVITKKLCAFYEN